MTRTPEGVGRIPTEFDKSVFINCPFDEEFRPILEALLFCILDCGLTPRVASERQDGEVRLHKIIELIHECRYSVHDLSRVQAGAAGEYARLNMPFELGVDLGVSLAEEAPFSQKRLLVLSEERYDYQIALSDLAGWDVGAHRGQYDQAIRRLRAWLASLGLTGLPPSQIVGDYIAFQEWDYERLLAEGWSDRDIQERPTAELMSAMVDWVATGRPTSL